MLNEWKTEVLIDLYHRTLRHLAGDSPSASAESAGLRWLHCCKPSRIRPGTLGKSRPCRRRSCSPCRRSESPNISANSRTLQHGDIQIRTHYLADTQTVEYIVGTHEDITPGVFHKLTGGLTSQGLEILSADINTLHQGIVLDRFVVRDPDYADEPPAERLEQVNRRLVEALRGNQQPAFRRLWSSVHEQTRNALAVLPTRVRADNNTSDHYTILDIFSSDRTGLLYTIARTIFELELSVSLAKIGTYLDQVVDVFYVTDLAGRKVDNETRLEEIRPGCWRRSKR